MVDAGSGDLTLPLVAMNPMGKDHVPAHIDQYLALDAESIAARAVTEAAPLVLPQTPQQPEAAPIAGAVDAFTVCLVVSDDLKGGWTNRYASEFTHRFESQAIAKRGWLVALLWTSETPSTAAVRDAVRTSIHRAAYLQRHPPPTTLGEMLAQEGFAAARAGCTTPALDPEDLAYTRAVIAPHLTATDRGTAIACLFGDTAARALGYPPMGLTDRAGFALALHDAGQS
jgi:hypothetical protein